MILPPDQLVQCIVFLYDPISRPTSSVYNFLYDPTPRPTSSMEQQPTSGGTVRSPDLQIVVISSLQTVSSTVFRFRVSLQRLN